MARPACSRSATRGGTRELWDVPDDAPATTLDQTGLRIIHLAESAPAVELRVSPADGSPVVLSPFSYGAATAYLTGSTGPWRVTAVTAGGRDTLLATAPMPLRGGTTHTVFLLDSPTGRVWATIVEALPADRP